MATKDKLRNLAILALLGATLGYVLINVSIRLLGEGFQPLTLSYLRFGVGFLLGMLFLGKKTSFKKFREISFKDWLLLIGMGTLGYAIPLYFFTLGVFKAKLLIVSVLSATLPFFTLAFSTVIFKKLPKPLVIPFLLISLYGVMLISTKSYFPVITHFGIGEVYILLFAAFGGIYPIFRKMLSPKISNNEITLSVIPIALLTLVVFAVALHETLTITSFFNWQVLLGLFIGGGLNFLLTHAENFGFEHLGSVFATQLLLIENIFAPVVGYLLYREFPSFIEAIGALLIIIGIYFVNKFSES